MGPSSSSAPGSCAECANANFFFFYFFIKFIFIFFIYDEDFAERCFIQIEGPREKGVTGFPESHAA